MNSFLAILVAVFTAHQAYCAILIEDPLATTKAPVFSKTAATAMELRKIRRAGIGLSAAGALGIYGINLELNFTPKWGANFGYGGGSGFQSFSISGKRFLGGETILPYIAAGYSNWASNSDQNRDLKKSSPSFLADRFLTEVEKRTGQFSTHLLFPSIGAQYLQPSGPWTGYSLYLELVMLVDIAELVSAPTGGLGFVYYF